MKRQYEYRNLPCSIQPDPKLWCVCGFDLVEPSGGVMEWCYDEADAKEILAKMQASGEFEGLSASLWSEQAPKPYRD